MNRRDFAKSVGTALAVSAFPAFAAAPRQSAAAHAAAKRLGIPTT